MPDNEVPFDKNAPRFGVRLWSEEVAQARAQDIADIVAPGQAGIAASVALRQPGYEFSGGRKFYSPR